MRRALLLCLFLLPLACRMPATRGPELSTANASEAEVSAPTGANTLGPGDLVEIRVYGEDLSGAHRVAPEGTIDFPLCGKVKLSGLSTSQAADAITRCLQDGYLKAPQVSVLIREYNSKKIFVFGEVQKPGTFPFEGNMSIIQAITLAGGFTKLAAKNSTNVTRLVDGQEKKVRVPVEEIGQGKEKNFLLQPGDIVFVPESFF